MNQYFVTQSLPCPHCKGEIRDSVIGCPECLWSGVVIKQVLLQDAIKELLETRTLTLDAA